MNTKIISNHLCKTDSVFYDADDNYLGSIDLVQGTIDIEGKFIPLSVNYKYRKALNDYSYGYINMLKRKFFVEAYTSWMEAKDKPIEVKKPQKGKKSRKSWFKRLIPILSIFSSILGIWRVL